MECHKAFGREQTHVGGFEEVQFTLSDGMANDPMLRMESDHFNFAVFAIESTVI